MLFRSSPSEMRNFLTSYHISILEAEIEGLGEEIRKAKKRESLGTASKEYFHGYNQAHITRQQDLQEVIKELKKEL